MTISDMPSDFTEKWIAYFRNFHTADMWSVLIGVMSIVIISATPRFSKKIPGSLIAIILMTLFAAVLKTGSE